MRMKSPSVRRLISLLSASALVATLAVATLPAAASAAAPPAPFFNGFETDTAGWFDNGGTITRFASGDTSTTYASGILPATDGYFARLGIDPSPTTCPSGGGDQPAYSAPFTRWGGYESVFPTGGYSTAVDIYLDVPYATSHFDTRFDWSSAINKPDGTFLRDFVFNVGTDASGFVIAGGNNATRCGANPATGNAPVHVTASGWYTFKHTFTDQGGVLSVNLQLINKLTNAQVGSTWVLSDPSDTIGGTVGGHRYGWFVQNEFDGLAIDNSQLTGLAPKCTATGFIRDGIDLTAAQIGGAVTGTLDATGCNIGAYNPSSVTGATIFGANYFGVVANGGTLDVTTSSIHNIGEAPFNGSQHGVGIYYTGASGTISGNTVSLYQKGGIVARDGGKVTINNNVVTGQGPINYIAQNGIQVSFGTSAKLFGNNVSLNNYTPPKVTACGLLIYKAGGVSGAVKAGISFIKADNNFHNNETDICNVGKGGGFSF